ncbi:MAG: SpoVG family protein [Pirellulaceae bacterium]
MKITDVSIKLVYKNPRLKAFASVVLDNEFVVHDIKVIERDGGLLVAMPNRKKTFACPTCGCWNNFSAKFCNHCGKRFSDQNVEAEATGRDLFTDVAHPILADFRSELETEILRAYEQACSSERRNSAS